MFELGIDWKAIGDRAKRALRWALLCLLGFGAGSGAVSAVSDCCGIDQPVATVPQK